LVVFGPITLVSLQDGGPLRLGHMPFTTGTIDRCQDGKPHVSTAIYHVSQKRRRWTKANQKSQPTRYNHVFLTIFSPLRPIYCSLHNRPPEASNGHRQMTMAIRPKGGKWPSIISYVYNLRQEDGVGIVGLEALNAFNSSQPCSSRSTHFCYV